MPKYVLAVALQAFGALCFGIAAGMVLDHFGLVGGQTEGTADEWLWIAGFLAAGGLLFWMGTVLRRTRG
jgi:hypothetical protein